MPGSSQTVKRKASVYGSDAAQGALPIFVFTSACTASPSAPNIKWMYTGRVCGSLWFTILARSKPIPAAGDSSIRIQNEKSRAQSAK